MTNFTKCIVLFFSLMASSVAFFSCTDVDKTLGLDFIPDDEKREFKVDTIYPNAYTVTMDSVHTHSSSTLMIGSYYDPIFGLVTAGSAFQILPIKDSVSFGTNPTYTSLIMQIPTANIPIGDKSFEETITVYELKERIYIDSAYYPSTPIQTMIESTPIASTTYKGEDTLKIELGAAFAGKLLNASLDNMILDTDTMYNSKFFEYVKGLYVTSSSARGSERINFFSPVIDLALYFDNAGTADTCRYNTLYYYDSYGSPYCFAHFNVVERDYSQADPLLKINHLNDTTATGLDSALYIQGFFGATPYVKISASSFTDWLQSINFEKEQISILRAELVLEAEEFSGFDFSKYPVALGAMTLLNPLVIYSAYYGQNLYLGGYLSTFYYGLGLFDGQLNATHKKYSFNITHEVADQIRNNKNLEFYLTPYQSNGGSASSSTLLYNIGSLQYGGFKGVLRGPTHSKPPKLIITYAVNQ